MTLDLGAIVVVAAEHVLYSGCGDGLRDLTVVEQGLGLRHESRTD